MAIPFLGTKKWIKSLTTPSWKWMTGSHGMRVAKLHGELLIGGFIQIGACKTFDPVFSCYFFRYARTYFYNLTFATIRVRFFLPQKFIRDSLPKNYILLGRGLLVQVSFLLCIQSAGLSFGASASSMLSYV